MNRELTNLEGFLVIALLVCGVVATLAMTTGCASWKPVKAYDVKPFRVEVGSPEYVQTMRDVLGDDGKSVRGFYHKVTRTAYVPYGIGDMPDFHVVGHEVAHLPEFKGDWHE